MKHTFSKRTAIALSVFSGTVATIAFISACKLDRERADQVSELDWLANGNAQGCTMRFAREPAIRVCVYGNAAQGQTLEKSRNFSKRALLTWFRALRQIDDQVSSDVTFSCEKPHLKVNILSGNGTSMARCGYAQIYSQRPYGTYLHEFGHAVAGLGDTYYGGSAGNCISGHPQSVMCWGAYGPDDQAGYNRLFPDDVKGIQTQYRKIIGAMQPPKVAIDPFAPLDPNAPWPKDSPQTAANDQPVTPENQTQ